MVENIIFQYLYLSISLSTIAFCAEKFILSAFLAVSLLSPFTFRLVLFDLDFNILRIIILIIFIKIVIHGKLKSIKIVKIDKILIAYILINVAVYTILRLDFNAFINRLGFAYNGIGTYIIFRVLIRSEQDISKAFVTIVWVSFLVSVFMLYEQIYGKNLFSVFGLAELTRVRGDIFRSQGPFAVPILAGTFGSILLPMIYFMHHFGSTKRFIFGAAISCVFITLSSFSSGPIISLFAAIFGILYFPFRQYTKGLISISVITAFILHFFVMNSPVWAIINKIGFLGGSSYHRYKLIDNFIEHYNEWFILGTETTEHWGYMMWDSINAYVKSGIEGGILGFITFIYLIKQCFKEIGIILNIENIKKATIYCVWSIGVLMFVHVVSFFGIVYFDQTILLFYLTIATVSFYSELNQKNQLNRANTII